jgi:long-subunit acyl-CoA synthetase (AMP-forming)
MEFLLTLAGSSCVRYMSLPLYQNPSATNQVIDRDGWLNTGDIGWIAAHNSTGRSRNSGGVIVVEGRAKDTIVLSSGRTGVYV